MLANYKITFTAALAAFAMAPPLTAQTSVTLDGTNGSKQINSGFSTNGGLTLDLGFFVDYLVIGGGGGGGGAGGVTFFSAGGGGGGQVRQGTISTASGSSYTVNVGAGGTGSTNYTVASGLGGESQFGGVTAQGGGGGATGDAGRLSDSKPATAGFTGGGGGGHLSDEALQKSATGTGGTGHRGGDGLSNSSFINNQRGGGGGGAGGPGQPGYILTNVNGDHAKGGVGVSSSITGTTIAYGGGGGGGKRVNVSLANVIAGAGTDGGGNGGADAAGSNAVANRGGGGGGAGSSSSTFRKGGDGGSGLVVVRYQGAQAATGGSVAVGSGSAADYTLHTFSTVGTSALDLSGVDMNQRLGVVHNGIISGSGDLTFTGPGSLTLNAANTYSGVTRVNAGTLALGSSGSIGSSSGVSIANGANFNVSTVTGGFTLGDEQTLSGGGTIAGDVTISGTHSPGFSPGIQVFADDLAYTVGSNVVWELIDNTVLDRGTDYDGVDVSGDLTFTGSTTITLDFALLGSMVDWTNEFWNNDYTGTDGWKIFDVGGEITGFENLTLAGSTIDKDGTSLTSERSGASFYLFEGADGVYLNYAAVPEPSVALLGGLGLLALLLRRR